MLELEECLLVPPAGPKPNTDGPGHVEHAIASSGRPGPPILCAKDLALAILRGARWAEKDLRTVSIEQQRNAASIDLRSSNGFRDAWDRAGKTEDQIRQKKMP